MIRNSKEDTTDGRKGCAVEDSLRNADRSDRDHTSRLLDRRFVNDDFPDSQDAADQVHVQSDELYRPLSELGWRDLSLEHLATEDDDGFRGDTRAVDPEIFGCGN